MALRGKKPTTVEKRLKTLFYGSAGVGKTTACIQFPKPYLIDTERGAENDQYTKILEKQGGVIFQTSDYDEVISEIKSLLTEKHEYKTLIIDPLTTVYNNLLDISSERVGTEFGRHYVDSNKYIKRLLNLLLRLDMNVIVTSHSKNEYGDGMKVLGQTFDCYKKLDYLFDLVIEIQKRGRARYGMVKKTRIHTFEEADSFEFTYDIFAEKYGRSILEKEAVAQALATEEQILKVTKLIDLFKVEKATVEKWLDRAQASTFAEMEQDKIQACIVMLEKKIQPEETKKKGGKK